MTTVHMNFYQQAHDIWKFSLGFEERDSKQKSTIVIMQPSNDIYKIYHSLALMTSSFMKYFLNSTTWNFLKLGFKKYK